MRSLRFTPARFPPAFSALAAAIAVLAGLVGNPATAAEGKVLRFASYATERPSEELRKLEPFQEQIQASLREQGINARVEVRIYPSYDEGIDAITTGLADFSRLGPVSYVTAKQRNPALQMLAVEAHGSDKSFHGVIIAGKHSSVKQLADLHGKRFAFGNPTSTTGRYIPQAALVKEGLTAKDFAAFDYLGRHDKVAFAVASGSYDAGATNEKTFSKYAEEKGLREIARFVSPTQAWVARGKLDAATVKALRKALLDLQGPGLDYIDRNGFLPGNDADYDELRRIMKAAQAFGG